MKFKLDENLGRRFGEPLRSAGHDVESVPDQEMAGSRDREIIEVCRTEGRCLVTLDLEFGNPLLFDPSAYAGIAVLRVSGRVGHAELMTAVQTLAGGVEEQAIAGKLWIVQPGRIGEYQQE